MSQTVLHIIPAPGDGAAHDTAVVAALWPDKRGLVAVRRGDPLEHVAGVAEAIIGSGGAFDFATPLTLHKLVHLTGATAIAAYTAADVRLAQKVAKLAGQPLEVIAAGAEGGTTAEAQPLALPAEGTLEVMWIGTIDRHKHLDAVMRAIAALPHPERVHLTVEGQGPGRWAMSAVRLARANHLNVTWNGDDWRPYYRGQQPVHLGLSPVAAVRKTFEAAGIPAASAFPTLS